MNFSLNTFDSKINDKSLKLLPIIHIYNMLPVLQTNILSFIEAISSKLLDSEEITFFLHSILLSISFDTFINHKSINLIENILKMILPSIATKYSIQAFINHFAITLHNIHEEFRLRLINTIINSCGNEMKADLLYYFVVALLLQSVSTVEEENIDLEEMEVFNDNQNFVLSYNLIVDLLLNQKPKYFVLVLDRLAGITVELSKFKLELKTKRIELIFFIHRIIYDVLWSLNVKQVEKTRNKITAIWQSLIKCLTECNEHKTTLFINITNQIIDTMGSIGLILDYDHFTEMLINILENDDEKVQSYAVDILSDKIQHTLSSVGSMSEQGESLLNLLPLLVEKLNVTANDTDVNVDLILVLTRLLTLLVSSFGEIYGEQFQGLISFICEEFDKDKLEANDQFKVVIAVMDLISNLLSKEKTSKSFIPYIPKLFENVSDFLGLTIDLINSDETLDLELIGAVCGCFNCVRKTAEKLPTFCGYQISLNNSILDSLLHPLFSEWPTIEPINLCRQALSKLDLKYLVQAIGQVAAKYIDNAAYLVEISMFIISFASRFDTTTIQTIGLELINVFIFPTLDYRRKYWDREDLEEIEYLEDETANALMELSLHMNEKVFVPLLNRMFLWAQATSLENLHENYSFMLFDKQLSTDRCASLFNMLIPIQKNLQTIMAPFIFKYIDLMMSSLSSENMDLIFSCLNFIAEWLIYCDNLQVDVFDQFTKIFIKLIKFCENQSDLLFSSLLPALINLNKCVHDDLLWKQFSSRFLILARHENLNVRRLVVQFEIEMFSSLSEEYLSVLSVILPYLSELSEETDQNLALEIRDLFKIIDNLSKDTLDI
eukprot:TRINITY_DN12118_c0_g1_i1.p1 TRINITY_DN12118_c0_g1~~TRINITY_DN12118_c0_g1_i1.p1  ORF type:complete len:834 (-),score=216.36 TRINITY_DN12118_c0_g1_i1:143-2644(-)